MKALIWQLIKSWPLILSYFLTQYNSVIFWHFFDLGMIWSLRLSISYLARAYDDIITRRANFAKVNQVFTYPLLSWPILRFNLKNFTWLARYDIMDNRIFTSHTETRILSKILILCKLKIMASWRYFISPNH